MSSELKDFLNADQIKSIHRRVGHPQNIYYQSDQLKEDIGEFVNYYNHQRYHESLQNITPADVYFGSGEQIIKQRQLIK